MTCGFGPAHRAQVLEAVEVAARHLETDEPDGIPRLATRLYAQWYAAADPDRVGAVVDSSLGGVPVAGLLRAAHPDAERWDPATVLQVAQAGVLVVRLDGGAVRAVARGDHAPVDSAGVGKVASAGERVLVRRRLGGHAEQGWWRTWGPLWSAARPPADLTRIYLAPLPGRAPRVLSAVVEVLDAVDRPWLMKLGASAGVLGRPDGAVVYLPDHVAGLGDSPRGSVLVDRLVTATRGLVGGRSPALTARLADGVAWSQDPGDGSSFGESICALLATALAPLDLAGALAGAGAGVGVRAQATALEAVERVFRTAYRDPATPHLCRSRKDAA